MNTRHRTIVPYDQHISENGAISDSTLKQQARGIKIRGGDVIVLGGKDYVERIRPLWVDCKTPLSGGLPQQMKWLKAHVMFEDGVNDQHVWEAQGEGRRGLLPL